ncbi:N-lysine methyltransferase KMT5A-A-like [Carassius gibelio]|uniref:N-lysine methyltransferase KMT5A-A-like n=1 Tax=Carassius gibelio TaxID=101364 RepID=UPI00227845AA|nr:N-lysine methyltransferase KMT5A-A-like [Carassius gibelio]
MEFIKEEREDVKIEDTFRVKHEETETRNIIKMEFIKEEREDVKIEDTFRVKHEETETHTVIKMEFIKEEREEMKIEDTFRVKHEETEEQTGRGVFATHPIEPGDFVLEYRGKLLTQEECKSRKYSESESTFLSDFQWQNHHLCLDASKEDGSLVRLVNDNHKNPNCVMKKIIVDNKPHL